MPGPGSCATTPRPGCCARRSRFRRSRPCSDTPARTRLRAAGSRRGAVVSGRGFTSAFAADLEAYLAFKQSMGHCGASRVWYLRRFDAWCSEHDLAVFDQGTVEGWVSAQLESSGRYRSWMSYIRDFGRWLQATGASDAYVLSGRWKAPFVAPRPYLLASRQIELFFTAAAALQSQSPWRWQAVAFFTLMHSCGLRTGETRALQPGQVDLEDGHIDVVGSKGNRSRRLPVTTQVTGVLAACDQASRAHFPLRRTFFVSAAGNQVSPCTAGRRGPTISGTISPTPASSGG